MHFRYDLTSIRVHYKAELKSFDHLSSASFLRCPSLETVKPLDMLRVHVAHNNLLYFVF